MDKKTIDNIRKYFVENRMFSELRGFNAGVRMFESYASTRNFGVLGDRARVALAENPRTSIDGQGMYWKRGSRFISPSTYDYRSRIGTGAPTSQRTARIANYEGAKKAYQTTLRNPDEWDANSVRAARDNYEAQRAATTKNTGDDYNQSHYYREDFMTGQGRYIINPYFTNSTQQRS